MAVSTINPWSAGAVLFDQRPYMAFYERQMAKEQAKNDALENYFKDLNKNITSTGMRSQDVPSLLQKNKDWQDHYIQNKAAILNPKLDNGDAYRKYMAGFQEQMALTNESKNLQKDDEELKKLKFNKDFNYVFDDPDILENMKAANLPIGDPGHKRFDVASAMLPPKPIDLKDRELASKYIVGDAQQDKIPGTTVKIGGFQTQTPITSQYNEKTLRNFGDRAADLYDSSRDWKYDAKKLFDQVKVDPVLHSKLDAIYKRHYGSEVDTPREAFIAKQILDHDIRSVEYKQDKDEWGLAQAKAAMQHGYTISEMRAKQEMKDKSESGQNTVIENLYNQVKEDAVKNKKEYKPGTGEAYEQYQMKASGAIKKMFAVPDDKGHLIYPDEIRYSKDFSTVTPIFYAKYTEADDDNDNIPEGRKIGDIKSGKGGRAEVIKEISSPILESEFKQRWKKELMGAGAYGKELGDSDENIGSNTVSPRPNPKGDWRSRSVKQ